MTKIFRIAAKPVAAAIALVGLLGLTACGGSSSRNVDLDPDDLKYAHDARTGLCFAFTGSGKVLSAETTGIAVAQVPCTPKVMAIVTGKPVASFDGAPFEPGRAYRCRLDADATVTCQLQE